MTARRWYRLRRTLTVALIALAVMVGVARWFGAGDAWMVVQFAALLAVPALYVVQPRSAR